MSFNFTGYISVPNLSNLLKDLQIGEETRLIIMNKVTNNMCLHDQGYQYLDIHFHKFECICNKCGLAIGIYDDYSNQTFPYGAPRNLEESTKEKGKSRIKGVYRAETQESSNG